MVFHRITVNRPKNLVAIDTVSLTIFIFHFSEGAPKVVSYQTRGNSPPGAISVATTVQPAVSYERGP